MNKTSREAQTAWPGGSVGGRWSRETPGRATPRLPGVKPQANPPPSRVALGVCVGLLSGTLLGTHETFHKYMLNE